MYGTAHADTHTNTAREKSQGKNTHSQLASDVHNANRHSLDVKADGGVI